MADSQTSGLSAADVAALISAAISAIPPSAFPAVNGGTAMTVAQLIANFPAGASLSGMRANVSDLYNNGIAGKGINATMFCRYDATNNRYTWAAPTTGAGLNAVDNTGAISINITPLVTPPTLRLTGGTGVITQTVTLLTTNGSVGDRQRIVQSSGISTVTTAIAGLLGGPLSFLGNGTRDVELGPTGWFQSY